MENVFACITMNEYYVCGAKKEQWDWLFDVNPQPVTDKTPVITDLQITGILGKNISGAGIYMYGLPELPISNVVISNVNLDVVGSEEGVEVIMAPDRAPGYGEGIVLENVKNVDMSNVRIRCTKEELTLKNCKSIRLNGKEL